MTGTEGRQIPPTTEHPPNWKHQDILSAFERIATEPANGAATKYHESGTQWTQALEQFRKRMEVSIASAWEGSSADASITAIRQYTTDADKLTPAFTAMSTQVTAAAASAVSTKSALPGEVDPGFLDSMPWNKAVVRGQREEAENNARDVMDNKYVMPFAGTDGAIPVLPRPTNPTKQQGDPGDKPIGSNTEDGGGQPNTDTDPTQPSTDTSDDTTEEPAESPSTEDPSSSDPASTDDGDPSTSPSATDPSATSPASTPTTPTAATPSSPGAGGIPGSGSGAGSSAGPGGTGAPGAGVPGQAIPGSPQAGALAAAASAGGTAGSVAGSRGMSGMPGMMGAGAGRGKDDESEDSIPDYLINESNTDELLGDRGFVVEGGVLGGQYPSANPPRDRTDDV
ncbi:hypothetical protein ACFWU5_28310 [Nocardia sp. NPDC058640]|uniref:hypothetical protein n=1 Tax=Nocardia sp. NPDC058640 TaxID=3346571 RepID=UPI003652B514